MSCHSAPAVHLNGTSKAELVKQLEEAVEAIRDAELALCRATPHARDYYVQGVGADIAARNEHRQRLEALQGIREELESIWQRVFNQQGPGDR